MTKKLRAKTTFATVKLNVILKYMNGTELQIYAEKVTRIPDLPPENRLFRENGSAGTLKPRHQSTESP